VEIDVTLLYEMERGLKMCSILMVYCVVTFSTVLSAHVHFMASTNCKPQAEKTVLPSDILQFNKILVKWH